MILVAAEKTSAPPELGEDGIAKALVVFGHAINLTRVCDSLISLCIVSPSFVTSKRVNPNRARAEARRQSACCSSGLRLNASPLKLQPAPPIAWVQPDDDRRQPTA
jgi:hypothetical protein